MSFCLVCSENDPLAGKVEKREKMLYHFRSVHCDVEYAGLIDLKNLEIVSSREFSTHCGLPLKPASPSVYRFHTHPDGVNYKRRFLHDPPGYSDFRATTLDPLPCRWELVIAREGIYFYKVQCKEKARFFLQNKIKFIQQVNASSRL